MSDSVTTSVELAVSPQRAFEVFTREIDAWYRVDEDTLPDITRTAAIRFEPHLGGRLLDVHDLESGEGRELARITAWEPGSRLAFGDNEGTEIEVRFEPAGTDTRVTLTHRGLERLGEERATELRRSGWGALVPLYREHLAPNARALAVAVALYAVGSAICAGGVWLSFTLAGGKPPAWLLMVVFLAPVVPLLHAYSWLVRRLVPSRWRQRQFRSRVLTFYILGLFAVSLYITIQIPAAGVVFLTSAVLMPAHYWSVAQNGPACGRSLRKGARSRLGTLAECHRTLWVSCLMVGAGVVGIGLFYGISAIDPQLFPFIAAPMVALGHALSLRGALRKRRLGKTLGCHPDLYLAVEQQLWEQDRRPLLLVHRPSEEPEHSGWHAYAGEQDEDSRDLAAWSIKDLVDHSPEAARPLREGRGKWRWDQVEHAYRPAEQELEHPQPA